MKHSAVLPSIPPISSAGVPGFEMNPWVAVFAPAATPPQLVGRLNAEINGELKDAGARQRLISRALDPLVSAPEEFDGRVKADHAKYAKLIKLTGAQVD